MHFNEFSNYIESVILSKEHLLAGDFNIHVDVTNDSDARKFLDLLDSFGFQQHVDKPTHIHGHTLDLTITRKTSEIIQMSPTVGRYVSDHATVICDLKINKPAAKVMTVTYRKLSSVDMDCLREDLASPDLCTTDYSEVFTPADLDSLVKICETTLSDLNDQHAPILTKRVRSTPQAPWYNKEIMEAKRQRHKAERIWRKSRLALDFLLFKKKKNYTTFYHQQSAKGLLRGIY